MVRLKIDLASDAFVNNRLHEPHGLFAIPFRLGIRLYRHTSLSWLSRASGDLTAPILSCPDLCIGFSLRLRSFPSLSDFILALLTSLARLSLAREGFPSSLPMMSPICALSRCCMKGKPFALCLTLDPV